MVQGQNTTDLMKVGKIGTQKVKLKIFIGLKTLFRPEDYIVIVDKWKR